MGRPNLLKSSPEAELSIVLPETTFVGATTSEPVALATQKLYGSVHVRYRTTACIEPHDTLQITFVGTFQFKSWIANHPCGELWDMKVHTEEIVQMARKFSINAHSFGTVAFPEMRRYDFSLQPCDGSARTVRLGPPHIMPGELLKHYEALQYACSRSVPSSTHDRFTLPRSRMASDHNRVAELSVAYKLHAVLLRPVNGINKRIAHSSKPITIFDDSTGSQPPTCTTDFKREYCLVQRAVTPLKRTMSIYKRLPHQPCQKFPLFVDTIEPEPLIFHKSVQYATTTIPLTLTLLGGNKFSTNEGLDLVKADVCLSWSLHKSSFSSVKGLKRPPTLEDVATNNDNDSTIVHKTSLQAQSRYKCRVEQWQRSVSDDLRRKQRLLHQPQREIKRRRCRQDSVDHNTFLIGSYLFKAVDVSPPVPISGSQSDHDTVIGGTSPFESHYNSLESPQELSDSKIGVPCGLPVQKTTIHLPVGIVKSALLAPTSFTSYIAIRYSLKIHVRVSFEARERLQGPIKHCWTAESNLVLPIQILYEGRNSGSGTGNQEAGRYDIGTEGKLEMQAEKLPSYKDSIKPMCTA